ncbi:MAG: TrkH family potassium uptake protein [Halanaerobiales bacterium]|nr:TrkH family potassium uptake protein [Halanaerobiales bacterium]
MILYIMSPLFILLGIGLLIPVLFCIAYNEPQIYYKSFIYPSIISFSLGIIFSFLKSKDINLSLTNSMVIVGLSWIVFSLIGGIPFIIGLEKSFIDAFFEAVSGFTTTGITVFESLSSIPHSIIIWRALIQWFGGLGIITFFLFITFRSEGQLWQLFTAESHKIDTSRPVPNIFRSIKILWLIYALFTVLQFILLIAFRVTAFDALLHSFTTLSTGGFSNYDASVGYYASLGHPYYIVIEYIFIIFMLLGGINFLIHFKVLRGNVKELFTNFEMKYFWSIIGVVIFLILTGKIFNSTLNLSNIEMVFRKTLFQVVSVMTTTGYGTESLTSSFFPALSRLLFLFLMLMGGCVGSTAGGIKVIRIAILNKLFKREIKRFYLPKRAIMPLKVENKLIDRDEIYKISGLFFFWLVIILIGGVITALFSNLNAFQSISGMFSAMGNIGPFYFTVEEMASLSPIIKLTYIFGMLAGRLEILPIFILFTKKAWK